MGCAKKQTVARISRGEIQQDIADERRNQSTPKIERGKDIYHLPAAYHAGQVRYQDEMAIS